MSEVMHKIRTGDYLQFILKLNNMKIRILKKKNPSKLQRMWIKHLIEWIKLETEYESIKKYYIQSCKNKINY